MGIVANVKKRNRTRGELFALTIRLRTSRAERKEAHGEGTTDEEEEEDDEVKWKRAAIGRLGCWERRSLEHFEILSRKPRGGKGGRIFQ